MALRRPPTRVELKADDIQEYDEVCLVSCGSSLWNCLKYLQYSAVEKRTNDVRC